MDSSTRPETPMDSRFGSRRSILRDRNTPATGQSVRFFSRDAFKLMTPEGSTTSEQGDSPSQENLHIGESNPQAELSPSGYGIHWPLIDEDLAVGPLLRTAETG